MFSFECYICEGFGGVRLHPQICRQSQLNKKTAEYKCGGFFGCFLIYAVGEVRPNLKIHLLFPFTFLNLLKLIVLIKASWDVSAYSYHFVGLSTFRMPI